MADKKDDMDLPHSDKKSGPGNTPGKPDPDAKNKPEMGAVGENLNEKKNTPPPDKQPHGPGRIDNRDQDPDHPANKTLSPGYKPVQRSDAEQFNVPPEELLTEQEKDVVGTGGTDVTAGVGPTSPAAHTTGPVETIEDQGIGPRTPYPVGNPPPPTEETTLSQGIWRGDEPGPGPNPNHPDRDRPADRHEGSKPMKDPTR